MPTILVILTWMTISCCPSLLNLWTFATQRRIPDLQVSPCVKKMDSRMRPWRTHFTTVAAVQTRHIKTQDTFTTFQDNQFLNGNLFLVCPKCDHRNEVHGIQRMKLALWRTVQICAGLCRHAEFAWETSELVTRHRNLFGSDTNLSMEYGLPQLEWSFIWNIM